MGPLSSVCVRNLVEAIGAPGLAHLAKTSSAEAAAGGAGAAAGGEEGPRTAGEAEPAATALDASGASPASLAAIEDLKQHLRRVLAELAQDKPALVRCLQATAQCMIASRVLLSTFEALRVKEARALYEIGAADEDPDGAFGVSDASSGAASCREDLFLVCAKAVPASLMRITSLMTLGESGDAQSPESSPTWQEDALHPLTIMVASASLFWLSCLPTTHRLAALRTKPGDEAIGAMFAVRLLRRTLLQRLAQESDLRELGGLGEPFSPFMALFALLCRWARDESVLSARTRVPLQRAIKAPM